MHYYYYYCCCCCCYYLFMLQEMEWGRCCTKVVKTNQCMQELLLHYSANNEDTNVVPNSFVGSAKHAPGWNMLLFRLFPHSLSLHSTHTHTHSLSLYVYIRTLSVWRERERVRANYCKALPEISQCIWSAH